MFSLGLAFPQDVALTLVYEWGSMEQGYQIGNFYVHKSLQKHSGEIACDIPKGTPIYLSSSTRG